MAVMRVVIDDLYDGRSLFYYPNCLDMRSYLPYLHRLRGFVFDFVYFSTIQMIVNALKYR